MPTKESVIERNPKVMSGTPVFRGTRVPIQNLFDYLAAGDSLADFLEAFPSVARKQAVSALEEAEEAVVGGAHSPG